MEKTMEEMISSRPELEDELNGIRQRISSIQTEIECLIDNSTQLAQRIRNIQHQRRLGGCDGTEQAESEEYLIRLRRDDIASVDLYTKHIENLKDEERKVLAKLADNFKIIVTITDSYDQGISVRLECVAIDLIGRLREAISQSPYDFNQFGSLMIDDQSFNPFDENITIMKRNGLFFLTSAEMERPIQFGTTLAILFHRKNIFLVKDFSHDLLQIVDLVVSQLSTETASSDNTKLLLGRLKNMRRIGMIDLELIEHAISISKPLNNGNSVVDINTIHQTLARFKFPKLDLEDELLDYLADSTGQFIRKPEFDSLCQHIHELKIEEDGKFRSMLIAVEVLYAAIDFESYPFVKPEANIVMKLWLPLIQALMVRDHPAHLKLLLEYVIKRRLPGEVNKAFSIDFGISSRIKGFPLFLCEVDDASVGRFMHKDFLKLLLMNTMLIVAYWALNKSNRPFLERLRIFGGLISGFDIECFVCVPQYDREFNLIGVSFRSSDDLLFNLESGQDGSGNFANQAVFGEVDVPEPPANGKLSDEFIEKLKSSLMHALEDPIILRKKAREVSDPLQKIDALNISTVKFLKGLGKYLAQEAALLDGLDFMSPDRDHIGAMLESTIQNYKVFISGQSVSRVPSATNSSVQSHSRSPYLTVREMEPAVAAIAEYFKLIGKSTFFNLDFVTIKSPNVAFTTYASENGDFGDHIVIAKPSVSSESELTLAMAIMGVAPKLYDLKEFSASGFTVYDFEKLEDINKVMAGIGRLPFESLKDDYSVEFALAISYVAGAVTSLKALHSLGYVHSDVSPSNIMRSSHGKWYLIDYGQAMKAEMSLITSRLAGTEGFIAPEAEQSGIFTFQSDCYSLGQTLKQIWGNFFDDHLAALFRVNRNWELKEAFGRIINGLCQKETNDRWTLDDVCAKIDEIIQLYKEAYPETLLPLVEYNKSLKMPELASKPFSNEMIGDQQNLTP